MNPKKAETGGKVALAALLAALGVAAKKYGPVVAEKAKDKAKEAIPAIIKIVLRRG